MNQREKSNRIIEMSEQPAADDTMRNLTAEIVSSYVANNSVGRADLPTVIASVYSALTTLDGPKAEPVPERRPMPVSIKKSVTPDYLVSMEDGKHYQSLKRHLTTRGLTPAEYRTKWGLPHDYPMTAPVYSAKRSELAKALGLGRKREGAAPAKKGGRRKAA